MADAVSTQIINNGPRNITVKFTNFSDGTGESGVVKLDSTSNTFAVGGQAPGIHWKVWKIQYDVHGMELRIQWVASSNQDMLVAADIGMQSFMDMGGLTVPVITGATGQISFTTQGQISGSSYSVLMYLKKGVPQS